MMVIYRRCLVKNPCGQYFICSHSHVTDRSLSSACAVTAEDMHHIQAVLKTLFFLCQTHLVSRCAVNSLLTKTLSTHFTIYTWTHPHLKICATFIFSHFVMFLFFKIIKWIFANAEHSFTCNTVFKHNCCTDLQNKNSVEGGSKKDSQINNTCQSI